MITALLLLGVFLIFTVLSVPIIMGLAGAAMFGLVYADFGDALYILPQQVLEGIFSGALLAVPFFIMTGSLLNKLEMTDRIFNFASALVSRLRGGLAQVNIVSSMIFAGMSGAAVADCAGLGMVEIKAMKERGYPVDFAAAVTAASSIVGPIIPPSIPFLIYAYVSSTSVGRLFLAGIIPGLLIGLGLMIFTRFYVKRLAVPVEPRVPLRTVLRLAVDGIAALCAPAIIVVAMTTGYSTASEAGVLACAYSILIGFLFRTISWRKIWEALTETMLLTALIMMMLGFSVVMGWIMAIEQVPQQLADTVLTHIDSKWLFLAVYLIFFLIIGCVFDTLAAMIILTPILLPITDLMGIDRIHFGVITTFVLMLGILTPPLGIALYIMTEVSGASFERVTKAVIPFLIPLALVLVVLTYIPEITLWLPDLLMGPE